MCYYFLLHRDVKYETHIKIIKREQKKNKY